MRGLSFPISDTQHDFLIEHYDSKISPGGFTPMPPHHMEDVNRAVLIERKLVAFDKYPPKFTVLNEKGAKSEASPSATWRTIWCARNYSNSARSSTCRSTSRIDKLAEALRTRDMNRI